jgi:hypothetical protein
MQCAAHSRTRKTLGANATLLLVLGSLLFTQFSATTHQLAVQHATCPQHGEVVDIAVSAAATQSTQAGQPSHFSQTYDSSNQTPHQHCPFVSSRVSHKIFKLQPLNAAQLPAPAAQIEDPVARAPHNTAAVYLTAPKHSPPAA